ncbi:toxin-antitoxin system HicB family antitoxin [Phormidium sp. FACHB-1136]|uniref:toxin-antitoxin system HicB family antitoxin n=1 Tax=Phormidium sp. FACHB-1136 TaxID=2692848 RepID=UPI001682BC7B|nr:toxin-antitoxin system HicB family antitoxin [Phormidium sp. FACHB-1136]MBD2425381.1 toxin-antitoxin system HicB family antitoxin [Phormidium sp. FACHB-1136]
MDDKSERQNFTIRMNPKLKQKAHQVAIEEGISLSDLLEVAVRAYLNLEVA